MIIEPELVLLLIFSFLSLFLGFVVWRKDPRSQKNIVFGLLALFATLWMLVSFLADEPLGLEYRFYLLKLDYILGVFLAYSFLAFCLNISQLFRKRRFILHLSLIPPLILAILILYTPYIISGYEIVSGEIINAIFGPFGFLYDLTVVFGALAGVGIILFKFRSSSKEDKTQFAYLFAGFLFTLSIILSTNILFTDIIEDSVYYNILTRFGSYSAVFLVLFPGYAIIRYKLLDIRIVSTEILSLALLVISFIQALTATSPAEFAINIIIFGSLLILAILLIKNMERELQRKEELQIMADKLVLANTQLKKLDKAKSEFISIASHQLRTPLTAIKGFISLILEGSYGKVDPSVRNALNKVYLSNERLIQLVEDLLSISRIESGRMEFKMDTWNVEDIAQDVMDMFILNAKEKGLELKYDAPSSPIGQIEMDGNKVREVISNLLDNAIKYTHEGSITLRLRDKKDTIQIIVEDTGIGIRKEDLPYLFEKFSRGKDIQRLHANGTGLGLYVGRNIVEAHNGIIYAESDGEGKGSRFIVELPKIQKSE